ncbi:transmembrane protein, partial [mine drainage metagenome]
YAEAGQMLRVELRFTAPRRAHAGLCLHVDATRHDFSIAADTALSLPINLHTGRRGWLDLPALKLESTWPFGLFRAWSWLRP